MKKNTVYVGLSADILHEGHINILKISARLGDVTVGLLTDRAISTYKKFPLLDYKQRAIVLKSLKYVKNIVPQDTLGYTKNLKLLKPNFLVHGDDWKKGIQKKTRKIAIKTLKKWGGKLIEPRYTKNISSSFIKSKIMEIGTTPDTRRSKLKRLIYSKDLVRIIESHNGLTGLIVEKLNINDRGKYLEFDGLWSSSLTDSTVRGKPDNQSGDYSTRILGLSEILDVTTKPVIFDADNGGRIEHIPYLVKSLERAGISAAVIEDKVGSKKNSLFKDQSTAKQDSIENFCKKIEKASNSKVSDDFLIVAKIESLILGKSVNDALKRAEVYSQAGADAILINSKEKKPTEVFNFVKKFKNSKYYKPMIAVPSTYSVTKEKDLIREGIKVVIYANHFLRAAYPAIMSVAKDILKNQRSFEVEKRIAPIKEILNLIN